jgi:hypothetical protein
MSAVKTCRHIMPTGRTCKSPAMRGSAYCYYHDPQKSPRRVSRATESEFEFEPIAEPACIPPIAEQILRALASNRISKGRAAVMFQGLQTILASFRMPDPDSFDPNPFDPSNDFDPNADPNLDPNLDPTPGIESLSFTISARPGQQLAALLRSELKH